MPGITLGTGKQNTDLRDLQHSWGEMYVNYHCDTSMGTIYSRHEGP